MLVKTVCFCVLMCVVLSTAVPVLQMMPTLLEDQELEPLHHVLLVKRSAGVSGNPCPGFPGFRCPHQDVPALCRGVDIGCLDTDFINVRI